MICMGTPDGCVFLERVVSAAAYAANELLVHDLTTNGRVSQAPLSATNDPNLVVGVAWDASTGAGEGHFMVPMNSIGVVSVAKDAALSVRGVNVALSATTNGRLANVGASARTTGSAESSNAGGAGTLTRIRLNGTTI